MISFGVAYKEQEVLLEEWDFLHLPAIYIFNIFNEEATLMFALISTDSKAILILVNDVTFSILYVCLEIDTIF